MPMRGRILTAVLAALLSTFAQVDRARAGSLPVADLEVTLALTETSLQAFQATRAVLTFLNHGPEHITATVGAGTGFWLGGGLYTVDVFPSGETAPCIINYTDLSNPLIGAVFIAADVFVQPNGILTGETKSCTFTILAYPNIAGTEHEVQFFSSSGRDDPNPDNDNPSVTLSVVRPLADIEATIDIDTVAVDAGDRVRAVLTLTNHGPTDVVAPGVRTEFVLGDPSLETIATRFASDTPPDAPVPPCLPWEDGDFSQGGPSVVHWTYTLYPQPIGLAAGETRSCVFDIEALPALDGRVHDVHFAVAAHIDDPDPTNSSPVVRLRVGQPALPVPQQVPASAGPMLALAVLGALAFGLLALRRSD